MIRHTYTYWQIRKYFRASGMDLRNVTPYKGNRYGKKDIYEVYDIETGKVKGVATLDFLRKILRKYDFPIDE